MIISFTLKFLVYINYFLFSFIVKYLEEAIKFFR